MFSDDSYLLHMSMAILAISTLSVALMLLVSFRPRVVVLHALREEDSQSASDTLSVDETTVAGAGDEGNGLGTVKTTEETVTIIIRQLLRPRHLHEGGTNEPHKPVLNEDEAVQSSHDMGRRIVRRRLVEEMEESLDENKDEGIDSTQPRQNLFAQAKKGPVSEFEDSASDAPSLVPTSDPSSLKATGAPSFFRELMSSPSQDPSYVSVSPSSAPTAIDFVSGSSSPSGGPSSPPSSAPSAKTVGGGDATLPTTKGKDFVKPSSSPTTEAQLADSLTLSPPAPKDSAEQTASDETVLNQDSSAPSHAIPAIMVGLASSVVFCALFLYCADARDKRKHSLWLREQREIDELPDDNSSEKSLVVNDDNEGGHQLPACAVPTFDSTEQSSDGSNVGSQGSGYWIHAMMKDIADYNCPSSKYTNAVPPPNMLPPLDREGECNDSIEDVGPRGNCKYDDLSISRVSTLTTSVMEESLSPARFDTGPADVDGQGGITSLLRQSRSNGLSDCSSLTDGSIDDINGVDDVQAAMLLGEQCLPSTLSREAEDGRDDSATGEAAASPGDARDDDEMDHNDDYAGEKADLSQQMRNLEELIASINPLCAVGPPPLDLPPLAEEEEEEIDQRDDGSESRNRPLRPLSSSKREIFFVPPSAGGKGTIGLTFEQQPSDSLSHPIVSKVEKESTFVNRIFPGDAVLAVDDLDTVGLLGSEVVNLMVLNEPPPQSSPTSVPAKRGERTIRMIKLTVMGRGERQKEEYMADSSSSSNGSSTDFGTVGGREEV